MLSFSLKGIFYSLALQKKTGKNQPPQEATAQKASLSCAESSLLRAETRSVRSEFQRNQVRASTHLPPPPPFPPATIFLLLKQPFRTKPSFGSSALPKNQRFPHQHCLCSPATLPNILNPCPAHHHPVPIQNPAAAHHSPPRNCQIPLPSFGTWVPWHPGGLARLPSPPPHIWAAVAATGPSWCLGSADISAVSCPPAPPHRVLSPDPTALRGASPRQPRDPSSRPATAMESVALYSFQATEKDELPFQKGDTLKVPQAGVTSRGVDAAVLGDRVSTW